MVGAQQINVQQCHGKFFPILFFEVDSSTGLIGIGALLQLCHKSIISNVPRL